VAAPCSKLGCVVDIETDRLIMRRWQASDLEPFAALNADPVVMEHFPAVLTRRESDALVARIEAGFDERGYGLWALETKADATMIGFCGLELQTFPAPFTPAVEVGWRLAHHAWGHGYASEAARAAIAFAFDEVHLDEVVSMTAVSNVRSQRVMERIGMTRDHGADFMHPKVPAGSPLRPHVLYRLHRRDRR